MVVHGHAKQAAGLGNPRGDRDIGTAGFGISAGVVVHQDQRGRANIERLADHFARVDRRLVDRPLAKQVVEDQPVLRIQVCLLYTSPSPRD